MKRIVFLSAIIYVVLLFSTENIHAQADARYTNGVITEISDLLAYEEMQDCSANRYLGTISNVQTSGGQIKSFTLKMVRGSVKINVSPSLYAKRIKIKDAANLPTLIVKGNRVTVDAYACGASGKNILAMYILAGSSPNTTD